MIMATIIPSIITGIVAIVVCLLNNHYAREKDRAEMRKKQDEVIEAYTSGLRALLKSALCSMYKEAKAKGYITIDELGIFNDMYAQYHKLANSMEEQEHPDLAHRSRNMAEDEHRRS